MISSLPTLTEKSPPVLARRRETSVLRAVFVYLFLVFIGGALIAPRFYASAQFLESVSGRFAFLADQPFHLYVKRCLILLAIVALPNLLKSLQIKSAASLGLKLEGRHWVEGLLGFGWGFVALALASALAITFGARVPDLDHNSAQWIRHLKNASLAAIVVAFLEELLFRGGLFVALRRTHRFFTAALASSAIYALLHFLGRPASPRHIEWDSGLVVLGQMLAGFAEWQALFPGFFNLTLAGFLFALVFERTGAIHCSFGLHASLVFGVKTFSFLTDPAPNANAWVFGSDKLVDGWSTGILLLLLFFLLERTLPHHKRLEE